MLFSRGGRLQMLLWDRRNDFDDDESFIIMQACLECSLMGYDVTWSEMKMMAR